MVSGVDFPAETNPLSDGDFLIIVCSYVIFWNHPQVSSQSYGKWMKMLHSYMI